MNLKIQQTTVRYSVLNLLCIGNHFQKKRGTFVALNKATEPFEWNSCWFLRSARVVFLNIKKQRSILQFNPFVSISQWEPETLQLLFLRFPYIYYNKSPLPHTPTYIELRYCDFLVVCFHVELEVCKIHSLQ